MIKLLPHIKKSSSQSVKDIYNEIKINKVYDNYIPNLNYLSVDLTYYPEHKILNPSFTSHESVLYGYFESNKNGKSYLLKRMSFPKIEADYNYDSSDDEGEDGDNENTINKYYNEYIESFDDKNKLKQLKENIHDVNIYKDDYDESECHHQKLVQLNVNFYYFPLRIQKTSSDFSFLQCYYFHKHDLFLQDPDTQFSLHQY